MIHWISGSLSKEIFAGTKPKTILNIRGTGAASDCGSLSEFSEGNAWGAVDYSFKYFLSSLHPFRNFK